MLKLIEFRMRYLRSKTNYMILKNSSKLIEIDENQMKTKLFVTKIILVTFGVFWNPQHEQFSKLSLDLHFEQDLKEILRVLH